MIIPLLIIFIFIEIVQTWLILFEKRFIRGIKEIILTEILELPLIFYLVLQGEALIILIVIAIEVLQWLAIAILFNLLR